MAYNFTVRTIEKIGWQFYLVNPHDHMYEKVEDFPTPSYTNQVIGNSCISIQQFGGICH